MDNQHNLMYLRYFLLYQVFLALPGTIGWNDMRHFVPLSFQNCTNSFQFPRWWIFIFTFVCTNICISNCVCICIRICICIPQVLHPLMSTILIPVVALIVLNLRVLSKVPLPSNKNFSEIQLLPLPFPNTTCTVYFTEIQPVFLPKTNQGSKYILSRCRPILGRCPHPGGGEIIPDSSYSLALLKLMIIKQSWWLKDFHWI